MPGCSEMPLDLLERREAVDLLLRGAKLPMTDDAVVTAAGRIVDLCGVDCFDLLMKLASVHFCCC